MDTTALFVALLFGAIGIGCLVYGKKQRRGIAMGAGTGLRVFPYFVSNVWVMVAVGLVPAILPLLLQNWEA